jgi:hypothetical protein
VRPNSPALPVYAYAFAFAVMVAASAVLVPPVVGPGLAAAPAAASALDAFFPDTTAATDFDQSSFSIVLGGRKVGTEKFIHFMRRDTVFSYSTVRLDGLADDSPMPLEKRTSFLQRRLGSFPLFFEAATTERDTSAHISVSCLFSDTTVVVYRERGERGIGEALALPPGRMYLFEPGVYHPVQLLLADFVEGTQSKRKQLVFVPATQVFIDLTLTRGASAPLRWGGKNVPTTKVALTDGTNEFIGWMDEKRKLLRLEAIGQGLVIERAAPAAARTSGAKPAAKKKSAAKKG